MFTEKWVIETLKMWAGARGDFVEGYKCQDSILGFVQ